MTKLGFMSAAERNSVTDGKQRANHSPWQAKCKKRAPTHGLYLGFGILLLFSNSFFCFLQSIFQVLRNRRENDTAPAPELIFS